jgi:hypothetical protein
VFDAAASANEQVGNGFITNATSLSQIRYNHPVRTRVPITGVTVSNPTNFVLKNLTATPALSALIFLTSGRDGTLLQATTAALTAGQACILMANNANCRIEFTGARL